MTATAAAATATAVGDSAAATAAAVAAAAGTAAGTAAFGDSAAAATLLNLQYDLDTRPVSGVAADCSG